MAVDKNSKAYNSLLNSGYTDEQITQMHNATSSGQGAQDVIANTSPVNAPKYDPMADLTQEYLANMDMNKPISWANQSFSQYWDDSSPEYQQKAKWWLNDKYTWEWVKNSDVNYNPDLLLSWLNPNFVYWQTSKVYWTDHPWYISTRNDEIASALYNEWLTTREDVANFLNKQKWFFDSSEADRANTIEAVWKRLWAIQAMQEQPKEPIDENALMEDTAWKLYWKTTAEWWDPTQWIDTIADANSIYAQMNQARVANVNALRSMQPINAATSTYYWTTPYWDQALRDVQNLDPEWYAQYQQELKKLYTQDKADTISHWSAWEESKDYVDSIEDTIVNDSKNRTDKNSDERTYDQVASELEKKLQSNQTARSAKQEMINIKKDLADLQSELDDLPNKAKRAFKWDVPDYIYQAYISNNRQELQKKIQNLENRYASLADIYKTEVANTQREMEYQLKQDQMDMDRTKMNFDMAYKKAQLEQDSIHRSDWKAYQIINWQVIQLDDWTAYAWYQNKVNAWLSSMEQMAASHAKYWQCEQFTDDAAEATAWVRMVWAGWRSYTTSDEKNWYATQFGLFSDYIPEVWDVAVFDYRNAKNVSDASRKYWHTMYVAWYDEATWMIHLIGSNGWPWLKNKVYSKDISVEDFYKNYWVWFWNPYKYAQWQSMQSSGSNNDYYSPMQDIIDQLLEEYKTSGKTNMFSELWKFQELYTNLYQADKDWTLSAMIDSWVLGTFLTNVAFNWAKNQGWDLALGDDKGVKNFLKLAWDEMLLEAESYVAKNGWFKDDPQAQKAYDWFRKMVRAIQIKLRDESWAAINKSERATDFLLFLPKASDSKALKESKLRDMEEYLRRMGTDAWINSKQYIPLNLGRTKPRPTD